MEKSLQFVDSYHEKNYIELVQNFMGKLNKDLYIVLKLFYKNLTHKVFYYSYIEIKVKEERRLYLF